MSYWMDFDIPENICFELDGASADYHPVKFETAGGDGMIFALDSMIP